jgi:diguanylate cyclase (GGDEF)-like protein/PAS domain S-box-containing protein
LASEQRFRDVAEASSDWIWEIGSDYRITFVSGRFFDVTGLSARAVIGQPISKFLTPDRTATADCFENLELDGLAPIRDMRCRYSDITNQTRICRLSGKPLFHKTGTFMGYRGTASDITAEVEAQDIAEHLALHDALTGLPNRIFMAERLDQNLAKIRRHGGAVSVICLDLDHFKEVNDTRGHAAGDSLLKSVTKRLESTLRITDTLARLGGDEFVIAQSEAIQPSGAEVLCRRILQVISEPFEVEGQNLYIGASLGVSVAPIDSLDPEQLLKNADVAMYRAKKDGRNSFRFFEAGMDAELQERKAMERDLRVAIQNNELEMYYQPLIETHGRAMQGVEALVRWNRPGFGMVPPGDFIPLAEETGLIIPLGDWILRTSCRQATEWPNLFVAVNLSPTQFKQQDLIGLVKQVLYDTGLTPNRLELEITEGVLLEQTAYSLMTLRGLQELGVRIAMDDFGTGYSSLS